MGIISSVKDKVFRKKEIPVEIKEENLPEKPDFESVSSDIEHSETNDNMEIIKTKLDLINARLENIDRRLSNIEKIAEESE